MSAHQPARGPRGMGILQSSIPKRPVGAHSMTAGRAQGLQLRAWVFKTYVYDSTQRPTASTQNSITENNSIFCDVKIYGRSRYSGHVLLRVPVAQPLGTGIHEGKIWKPRHARIDTTGDAINPNIATNAANVDADHVLITFLEDDLSQPIITGSLPHPSSDIGNAEEDLGMRMRLKEEDNEPNLEKRRGGFWGMQDDGNFVVDLRRAHLGAYAADGSEPPAAEDGVSGNYELLLPKAAKVTIKIEDGATLLLEDKDGAAKLTLGDGAVHVAIVEHLEALYGQLKGYIEGAKVSTSLGPSGTIAALSGPAPAWDPMINSTKLSLPDE